MTYAGLALLELSRKVTLATVRTICAAMARRWC